MKFGNKSTLVLLLSILFVFSCDDYCEMTDYESYLPLKIGNTWYYGDSDVWEVIGKQILDGEEYFDIKSEWKDGVIRHYFYRFDDSKLYKYFDYDSIEVLFADFSLKENDMFEQIKLGYEVTVWNDNPNEFELFYDIPEGADEEFTVKFRSGVGIIQECSLMWGCLNVLTDFDLK